MSAPVQDDPTPLDSLQECTAWVLSGRRDQSHFRIGTEYERLAIDAHGNLLPYEGPVSIRTLLDRLVVRHGWEPVLEAGRPIALQRGVAAISLEPAGQFELSGAAMVGVSDMAAELGGHLSELRDVAHDLGVRFVHVGLNPVTPVDATPRMPKGRYAIMRRIMPKVGAWGLHMMHLTCTVQTNIDFSSEDECMEMLRLGHLLSPVLIALFANSPYLAGRDTGFASFRAHLWTDVDDRRCNVKGLCFDPNARVQDYVDWLLDVPMYFLDKVLPDGSHGYEELPEPLTFRRYFHQGYHGRRPTLSDWALHASTVFPDVRLKRYIELRQCDLVPADALPSLPALTKGAFYDEATRKALRLLLRDGDRTVDRAALREAACKDALHARVGDVHVGEWAREVLRLTRIGLERQAADTRMDVDAADALQPLEAIAAGDAPPFYDRVRREMAKGTGLLGLADAW